MKKQNTKKGLQGRKAVINPSRHKQANLFIADILDVIPKGDTASMGASSFCLTGR